MTRYDSILSATLPAPPPKLGYFDMNGDVEVFTKRVTEYLSISGCTMPSARRPSRCRCIGQPKDCPNACLHLYLFAVHHTPDRRPFEHPVLECRVVLELSHRELAANTPRVEDEAIGIEHGVAIGEPFAFRQHAVDLLQVAVESLKAGVFERGEGSQIGRIPLGSADMGECHMHAARKEADER